MKSRNSMTMVTAAITAALAGQRAFDFDIYGTGLLNTVVDNLDQPSSFLLDLAFDEEQTFETEEILFDEVQNKPRITPFVAPNRPGVVVQSHGHKTKSFTPAYAKDKRHHKPNRALRRQIGETIGGQMTPQQRREMALRLDLVDQLEMLTRREEVMASEALRLGQVTVVGEGYPSTVVSFDRAANLTIALAGGNQWGEAGVSIVDNLEDWAGLVQTESGASPRIVIFDPKAWKLARKDEEFLELFERRRGSTSTAETGPIVRGQGNEKARMVGTAGDLEIWVYQDSYVDPVDNQTKQLLPDYTCIMLAPQELEGVRAYGAIQDEELMDEGGSIARRFWTKSWTEKDPGIRWLLMQSAPLVVPYRRNASLCATVASD